MPRCLVCSANHNGTFTNCNRCLASSRRWKKKFWYKHLLQAHKHQDRQKGLYDANTFCTGEQVLSMLKQQDGKCYYCGIMMKYPVRQQHDGLTIQRLDNTQGHVFENCVLCCRSCNVRRVEMKTPKSEVYLRDRKWEVEWLHMTRSGYQCLGNRRGRSFVAVD